MHVSNHSNTTASAHEIWFDDLIAALKTHQLMLETKTADKELSQFYSLMMDGNTDEIASHSKQLSQRHFIAKIILEYLSLIKDNTPLKLAFDYNDSEVLVWAEIKNDDEAMEQKLYLAEAKINAKYHQFGYDMTSMILEEGDGLAIPNHYKSYIA